MADEFVSATRLPDVRFTNEAALSPAALYIGPGEQLRISVNCSAPNSTVKISGRQLLTTGQIIPFEYMVSPTSDRAANNYQFALPEGYLLGLRLRTYAGFPTGRVFVCAMLVKGELGVTSVLQQIASGYISEYRYLGWPPAIIDPPRGGPGWLRTIVGTNPAAGAEISETVPTNAYWRVQSVYFQLTTDATATPRLPRLIIDDGTNVLATIEAPGTQAASLQWRYTWTTGTPHKAAANIHPLACLPVPLWLGPGWRIRTLTYSLASGDQYYTVNLCVEEFIEV